MTNEEIKNIITFLEKAERLIQRGVPNDLVTEEDAQNIDAGMDALRTVMNFCAAKLKSESEHE